jgi:hypothetical protein
MKIMVRRMSLVMVLVFLCSGVGAEDTELIWIADRMVKEADSRKRATLDKIYFEENTDEEVMQSLQKLTLLLRRYKQKFTGREEGPGQVQLGVTNGVKDGDAVLYFDSQMRQKRLRRIQIAHVSGDEYVRFRGITIVPVEGPTVLFNAGGGKFYLGDTYEIELDEPLRIRELRVRVQHQTRGLQITGMEAPKPPELPAFIELGRTNAVKDGNAVLHTDRRHRKVLFRKLIVKHVEGDEYVRLVLPQLTTTGGSEIPLQVSYQRLHTGEAHEIELPRPLSIRSIQVYVQHRTEGLLITGIR